MSSVRGVAVVLGQWSVMTLEIAHNTDATDVLYKFMVGEMVVAGCGAGQTEAV